MKIQAKITYQNLTNWLYVVICWIFQISKQGKIGENITEHVRLYAANECNLYSNGGDYKVRRYGPLHCNRHFVTLLPADVTDVDVHRSSQHVPSSYQSFYYVLLLLHLEKMPCRMG